VDDPTPSPKSQNQEDSWLFGAIDRSVNCVAVFTHDEVNWNMAIGAGGMGTSMTVSFSQMLELITIRVTR
jgi:hypothetical protein